MRRRSAARKLSTALLVRKVLSRTDYRDGPMLFFGKTCQLNIHDTQHIVDLCVHAGSEVVLLTRRASSTLMTLNTL